MVLSAFLMVIYTLLSCKTLLSLQKEEVAIYSSGPLSTLIKITFMRSYLEKLVNLTISPACTLAMSIIFIINARLHPGEGQETMNKVTVA